MDLLNPSIGNLFWTTVAFLILIFLLGKFAWRPILDAINNREEKIVDALNQVRIAKAEMEELKTDNQRIIREAKIEREAILKEAREIKDNIIREAGDAAKAEGEKMIEKARQTIEAEKHAAMAGIKDQIAGLSLTIAETVINRKLQGDEAQNQLVEDLINKANLN